MAMNARLMPTNAKPVLRFQLGGFAHHPPAGDHTCFGKWKWRPPPMVPYVALDNNCLKGWRRDGRNKGGIHFWGFRFVLFFCCWGVIDVTSQNLTLQRWDGRREAPRMSNLVWQGFDGFLEKRNKTKIRYHC